MLRLRALVIEDSKDDAELVEIELRRAGYDVVLQHVDAAETMTAALERQEWDVIFCDFNLPGFGAMDALEIVNGRHVDTPFIVLSESIGEEAVVEALKAGARDSVLKSNLARLVPVLERALGDTEIRRSNREAEQKLRESEERLQLALEAGRMWIWDLDPLTGTALCRGYGFDRSAFDPDEITSVEEFLAVIHADDRSHAAAAINEARASGGSFEMDLRLLTKDGSSMWATSRGYAVRDEHGETVRMIGITADITPQKGAEEELLASNELLHALLDSSPLAIAATDAERRMTLWNAAAERLFGWRKEDVLGREFPIAREDEAKRVDDLYQRLWAGEVIVDYETARIRKDGQRIDVSLSLAPLRDGTGEASGTVAIYVDVSERKRAREEVHRSLTLLRAANEERRRLLERLVQAQEEERQRIASDIHDDSVQVLTAVALRLGVAATKVPDDETAQMLSDTERTTRRAIDRLRRLMFELRPPALDRDGLAETLRLYLDQVKSDHAIEYALHTTLTAEPRPEIRATLYRIAQEAILNVTKHAGASRIDARVEERAGGVWVQIVDDGRGFSSELARAKVGHLGLDSMRERAELSGGWWKVASEPGSGTVVEFFLPMRAEVAA